MHVLWVEMLFRLSERHESFGEALQLQLQGQKSQTLNLGASRTFLPDSTVDGMLFLPLMTQHSSTPEQQNRWYKLKPHISVSLVRIAQTCFDSG